MSKYKPNSLIHYVDFNSSKIKGSKQPLISFDRLVNHLKTRHILTETLMQFTENKCRNLNSEAECN
jgi:hypothetical protein